ncbi:unnamed protein product [Alternaria alternata]
MDDNVGHTGNDTSALTSPSEDPSGGSRSLGNPEYSDTGAGDRIVQTVDPYGTAQHDLEMSWINQAFQWEWPSSKPPGYMLVKAQSQDSVSVYDVQPKAGPTTVSQLNGERLPLQYSNVHHARDSQSSSTDHPHPPAPAMHDEFYWDHFNLRHAGPSARGLDHTRSGFEKNNATQDAPYFSHGDDLGDKFEKCYNVHAHQGRDNTFFIPHQTLVGRRPSMVYNNKARQPSTGLASTDGEFLGNIDPPVANHTSGSAGKAHSPDVNVGGFELRFWDYRIGTI